MHEWNTLDRLLDRHGITWARLCRVRVFWLDCSGR
jgi:hypothetical protein